MRTISVHGEEFNVVETLNDVFVDNNEKEIDFIEEYNGYYYIRFIPESYYDEAMYKVNINTNKAECIHIIDYFIEVGDNGKKVDTAIFKRIG